jgi:hypothetical protein
VVEQTKETIEKEPNPLPVIHSNLPLTNCYAFVRKVYYPDLPSADYLKTHLQKQYAEVAVFYYTKSGLWHFAKTTGTTTNGFTIDEANYITGTRTQRSVSFTDHNLRGFYALPSPPPQVSP